MSDKKPTQGSNNIPGARRKLLKSALLGGGALYMAPERWTRPLIQSVVLPAHAQTSMVLGTGPWSTGDPFTDAGSGGGVGNIASRMVDFLVSPAAAGGNHQGQRCPYIICIEPTGNGNEIRVRLWTLDFLDYRGKKVTPASDLTFKNLKIDQWTLAGQYDAGADRWRGTINGPCGLTDGGIRGRDSSNLARGSAFTGERIQVASAGGQLRLAGNEQPPSIDTSWTARQGNCPPLPD